MFANLIFTGDVRHRRFKPKEHDFKYKLFMFCIDLSNIEDSLSKASRVKNEKFGLLSFHQKNYLNGDGNLESTARDLIATKFASYPNGKIYLLTNLTSLGYCFNPISIYFIMDENNQQVEYLILEVTNTPWGDRHHYVLKNISNPKNIFQHEFPKEMHVSPFMAMEYNYKFNLKVSNEQIIVHMENLQNEKKHFDATLTLKACPDNKISKVLWRQPFMSLKIITLIYWQALILFIKKTPFHTHPSKKGNFNHEE